MKKRNLSILKLHKKVISNVNFKNVNGGINGKPYSKSPDPKTVDKHACILEDYHS
ncbi:hypothetical protein [uncultured Kordia sp.]|uniref:hypothetical protein n=1 Tax=uncultured Kordia sp. TaxID=507699 RepID=UPI0026061A8A|nr:hypothetical protein [uncultured Kordia sp.]